MNSTANDVVEKERDVVEKESENEVCDEAEEGPGGVGEQPGAGSENTKEVEMTDGECVCTNSGELVCTCISHSHEGTGEDPVEEDRAETEGGEGSSTTVSPEEEANELSRVSTNKHRRIVETVQSRTTTLSHTWHSDGSNLPSKRSGNAPQVG